MADLAALIARVEGATGPDRNLDAQICRAVLNSPQVERATCPAYTASIDSAIALVQKHFPLGSGWNYTMAAAYGRFSIIPNDGKSTGIHDKRCGHGNGSTIPLSILSALLKALQARAGQ